LQNDIVPSLTPALMREKGLALGEGGDQHLGLLALIELPNGDRPTHYMAGTDNFYTITRYNWSSFYAMAVVELGAAVKAAMPR